MKKKQRLRNWKIVDDFIVKHPGQSWVNFSKAHKDEADKINSSIFYSRKYVLKKKGLVVAPPPGRSIKSVLLECKHEKVHPLTNKELIAQQPFLALKPADILPTPSDDVKKPDINVYNVLPGCRKKYVKYYKTLLEAALEDPTISAAKLKRQVHSPVNENSINTFLKKLRNYLGTNQSSAVKRKTDNHLYLKLCFIPSGCNVSLESTPQMHEKEREKALAIKKALTQLVECLVTQKRVNLEMTEVISLEGHGFQISVITK